VHKPHLLIDTDPGVDDAGVVVGKRQVQRQPRQQCPVRFAQLMEQCVVRWSEPRALVALDARAPGLQQARLVIAQHGAPADLPEQLEHGAAVGTAGEQITDENDLVAGAYRERVQ